MYIRRDRSNLHFGREGRNLHLRRIAAIVLVLVGIAGAFLRFESLQQWAINLIDTNATPTASAVELATQAEHYFQAGDLDAAVDSYRQAVALEPDRMDIAFEFGRALLYDGYNGTRYRERIDELNALAMDAVERAPDDARARALLNLALYEEGRYNEAVAAGLRAVELAPDFAEAWAYLSMAYYWSGRPSNSLETAERAVTLNSDSVDARRALAQALAYTGDTNAVIEQYQEALKRQPNLGPLYYELAIYYRSQGDFESAVAAYDQVLAIQPENAKAYTRKCATYALQGEFALSAETCKQAVELDPTYAEGYLYLGRAQYRNLNYEASAESFATCARLEIEQGVQPEDRAIDCVYIQGLSLALLNRCPEAWPLLTAALQMTPNDTQREAINSGMQTCISNDPGYSGQSIPTPVTPTPAEEEPITVF
ncbi:MAG TPA: tetratricopeptide repeat protein [Aggregatilinea sp.]|uniref:tetratricopeptide repeat protein n=1 Tax=Aggregatilinea sp. TaxID=2806333 RepID=UPI002B7E4B91|nr:tetratricopeptide repeat protein [Aggregatilinea sp.]HML24352.1 tetratricopeptide repeat protein [Aggregatilinea sp.]